MAVSVRLAAASRAGPGPAGGAGQAASLGAFRQGKSAGGGIDEVSVLILAVMCRASFLGIPGPDEGAGPGHSSNPLAGRFFNFLSMMRGFEKRYNPSPETVRSNKIYSVRPTEAGTFSKVSEHLSTPPS